MDWSVIASSFIVALATITSILLKEYFQSKRKNVNCSIQDFTQKSQNIQKALDFLMNRIKADRIYVYEFHNGDHFYSGSGQQKFSCTYESLGPGVSSETLNLQNLRMSTFNKYIKQLFDEDSFSFINDKTETPIALQNWFANRGITSNYARVIKTLKGEVIGALCIDFTNHTRELSKEEIYDIKCQARLIGGYLI